MSNQLSVNSNQSRLQSDVAKRMCRGMHDRRHRILHNWAIADHSLITDN